MIEFIKNILRLPFPHVVRSGDYYYIRKLCFFGFKYSDNTSLDKRFWSSLLKEHFGQNFRFEFLQDAKDAMNALSKKNDSNKAKKT